MLSRAGTEAALAGVFPLEPRRRVRGRPFGSMPSSRRGGRFDPVSSRPYRPGDDLRRIDRHASARLSAARDADELVVREHYAEEAARVVVLVDPAPTMALFPEALPWLHKPAAVESAVRLIEASAYRARSPIERHDAGAAATAELAVPRGTFVFVVSDFLAPPREDVWLAGLDRGLDLIPVIVQDPVWEQSFPQVAGAVLPVADPVDGRVRRVRLRRHEADERRAANEARLASLVQGLEELGLDPVLLETADDERVLDGFLTWSDLRRRSA
jgi:uncharacterized protein (DUF58 family)